MVVLRNIEESPLKLTYDESKWDDSIDFNLDKKYESRIKGMKDKFTLQGILLFISDYSKKKEDGTLETWNESTLRIIHSIFYFKKQQLFPKGEWKEEKEQLLAYHMGVSLFKKQWLPSGRGLKSMSKEFVKIFGCLACNNCAYATTDMFMDGEESDNLSFAKSAQWSMFLLMLGAGVGFDNKWKGKVYLPLKEFEKSQLYKISDDREGWVYSLYLLMESYLSPDKGEIFFDYSGIRKKGEPIKTYGGISGGPEPLILLHKQIRSFFECFYRVHEENVQPKDSIRQSMEEMLSYDDVFKAKFQTISETYESIDPSLKTYNHSRLITDIFNCIARCVASGNVGRSSEISLSTIDDDEFIALKNFFINPERDPFAWMSNNSIIANSPEEYDTIAKKLPPLILLNGEPGIVNNYFVNQPRKRRRGRKSRRHPRSCGFNPCAEVPLGPFGICNVPNVCPTNCMDKNGKMNYDILFKACRHAAMYASILSCIPTFEERSQKMLDETHRIGVSMDSLFALKEIMGYQEVISLMDKCFNIIEETCDEYVFNITGVYPIAHTSIKPNGKMYLLADVIGGLNALIEGRYVELRRAISIHDPLCDLLIKAGFLHEKKKNDPDKMLFIIPIDQGPCRTAKEVCPWEILSFMVDILDHFVNNAISSTISIDKNMTVKDLERMISFFLPRSAGFSFLPFESKRILKLANGDELVLDLEKHNDETTRFLKDLKEMIEEDKKKRLTDILPQEEYERGLELPFQSYEQKPFKAISKERYDYLISITPELESEMFFERTDLNEGDGESLKYCDGGKCEINVF